MVGVDMAALKAKVNATSTRINQQGATINFV
jgi:hypothetical protein